MALDPWMPRDHRSWLSDMRWAFAISNPRANMVITGITSDGPSWREAWPYTRDGRPPFWTRGMAGVREGQRDRRRHEMGAWA